MHRICARPKSPAIVTDAQKGLHLVCMGCTLLAMTLKDYMAEEALSDDSFALLAGCDRTTVYRIREKGQRPSPALMEKIAEVTGGLVQPNDFYGLSGLAA